MIMGVVNKDVEEHTPEQFNAVRAGTGAARL